MKELPAAVVELIHQGLLINAIKLLRNQRGCGLKEAKEEIDAYLSAHPEVPRQTAGVKPVFVLLTIALVATLTVALFFKFRS